LGLAVLAADRGMLVRAVGYALSAARLATPDTMPRPTPCAGWDLRTLLRHLTDSLDALAEALGTGIVSRGVAKAAVRDQDLVRGLSEGAGTLVCACAMAGTEDRRVAVGDRELTTSLVIMTGAIEIAVHGWDISVACAGHGTIPAGLARDLLPIAPLLVTPATRAGRFADPVPVPALAAPGDRLVAFLGRQPAAAANPPGLPGLPP